MSNFFSAVLALYKTARETTDVSEKVATLIGELKQKVDAAIADGVTFQDIPYVLGACADTIAQIAEIGGFASGADKKAFAMQIMLYTYKYIDNGASGTENRINIPYVPDSIEKWLEDQVLPFLCSAIIEGVVAGYNRVKN